MGRKVYHVFSFLNEYDEYRFLKTFTSFKNAKKFCLDKLSISDYKSFCIVSYDLKTHVQLGVWFSEFLEK